MNKKTTDKTATILMQKKATADHQQWLCLKEILSINYYGLLASNPFP